MADPIKLKLPKRGIGRLMNGAVGLVVTGVVFILATVGWFTLTVRVQPDEFAVRQVYLGPNKGVRKGVLGPGFHLVVPGYERLHRFPRDIQILDLNDNEMRAGRRRPDHLVAPSIRIQTSEGYQVTVDVTVLYRVEDPYTVLTRVGAGNLFETKVVARRADKILREKLGQLNAEDFYSDKVRTAKAEEARLAMTEDVAEWGIQIWGVLLREYIYDKRYQQAIEDRKIQDQKVFKNQAEAVAAMREAEKNRVLAEGHAKIAIEQERGRTDVRKIEAEADLYYRKRVAEAGLKVALAEAEGTRLENNALQSVGAGNMVGLEMADAMQGVEVIMISTTGAGGVNPLDLDGLLEGW